MPQQPSGGSRKGRPNKFGAMARENIIAVFNRIGGASAMAEWAKKNRTEFYKIYVRIIPTQVIATVDVRAASELTDDELIAIIVEAGSGERTALPQTIEGESEVVH